MTLERFQEETVQAAVRTLTQSSGVRRFLIADEVGLGKTVTAKAIAVELQDKRGAPLNAPDKATFYGGGDKGYTDYPALGEAVAAE